MFGQNPSPFGSPPATSTPFGQQQQQSAFGSPAPAFGSSTTAFGQQTTTPGFGQTQQQTGFGAFGSQTPAPATGGFGGFGSSTTQSTSPFGAPAPSTGGLFGSSVPAPATGGLFSSGASTGFSSTTQPQTSTFGSGEGFGSSTSTAFGAPAPSAFGAPASGSIFGAPTPAPAFGAPAPGQSIFGTSTAPAPGQSIFGARPAPAGGMFGQQQGVTGTASVPFQPTTKADGASSTTITFQSITAMPQYENTGKSFEELRFEDYSQGNRGTGSQTTTGGFGAFGSTPAPAPTGFGAFATPAPAPSGGLFGAPAPAPTGGLFGPPAPAPAGGSLFGPTPAPAPAFGGFGAPAPAPTGGLFGATPTPAPAPAFGAFGAPAPAPSGGPLFGGSPTPAPAFAGFGAPAPAPAGGSLFGQTPAPAPSGGLFGQLAPAPAPSGGLFGSAPAPAGGSLFGLAPAPAPGGFGFGSQPAPAPAFGAPSSGSLFGSPASAPGGLFGAPAPSPAPGGLFGAPATAPPPTAQPFASPTAMIVPPSTDAVLQQQLAAIENQRKELEQMEVWRGGSPQTSIVIPSSTPESQALRVSPYSPPMSSAVPYRASPRSTAKIRPRGFDTTPKLPSSQKTPMPFMSPDGFVASATKRLVIKSTTPKPSMRLRLRDVAAEETKEDVRDDVILTLPAVSPPGQASVASPPAAETPITSPPAATAPADSTNGKESTPRTNGHGYDFYKKVIASAGRTPGSKTRTPETTGSLVPKLQRPGYSMTPSAEEMESMSEAELATVSGFTVERDGVGSVSWDGSVDVRGVDLDEIIDIEHKVVSVYDEAELNGCKPEVGNKLNRRAVITMLDVFPKEGSDATAIEKYERKIAKTTKNMGAELISYDAGRGVWRFRVPHFSRYALVDDSDDEDEDMEGVAEHAKPDGSQNFETGERGVRSPTGVYGEATATFDVGATWFGAFRDKGVDEEIIDMAAVREKEDDRDKRVIREAESAYKMMTGTVATERARKSKAKSILKKQKKLEERQEDANALFQDEGIALEDMEGPIPNSPVPPSQDKLVISSKPGICSKIAQNSGIQSFSDSSTDYGMRMGRSFRVGWKPDGSFFHLRPSSGTVVQQSRPLFTDGIVGQEGNAKLLDTHLINSNKITSPFRQCPSYCLAPADNDKLRKAFSDYVAASTPQGMSDSDSEEGLVLMRAFSLLLALFSKAGNGSDAGDVPMIECADEGKARAALTEKSRIDACVEWLTAACAEDVRNDVRDALEKNDVYSAIFAASTGGDIEQATAIAMKHGYVHLASLLATGTAGFDSIREQVEQWHASGADPFIPAKLLRVYTILGGDLSAEDDFHTPCVKSGTPGRLDWRRRLCMLLSFGVSPDDEATLSSLIEKYGSDVTEGKAPYPSPRYIWRQNPAQDCGPQSLLYKILNLVKASGENSADAKSIANVVVPSGYTASDYDFSGSFHVASAISALNVGTALSPLEQARLLDSYASQLISIGRWDLAVYVMLCSFGVDRQEDLVSRERVAKAIVVQNCPEVPEGETISKRAELEQIGVPSAWFEEALAYRCGIMGDSFNYVQHLSNFSPEQARKALEQLVVPNMLFMNRADVRHSLDLLAAFSWDEDSLAATVVDFFQLGEDIVAISKSHFDDEKKSEEIASLSELAESVKIRLQAHRSYNDEIQEPACTLRVVPSYRVVPITAFLAEALAGVKFCQLQLGALAAGSSIWDDSYLRGTSARPLKVASELAFISVRNAGVSSDGAVASPVNLAGMM